DADRVSFVIEMSITGEGTIAGSDLYRALVRNRAKLAYDSVAAWLDAQGPAPPRVASVSGMAQQLRLQDGVAQSLKRVGCAEGALGLTTLEGRAVYHGAVLEDLRPDEDNRAKELIEYFMIAANSVVAQFLERRGSPSLRRVLRRPERWGRIVELARALGGRRPEAPHPPALRGFL